MIYHILIDRFNGGWTTPPENSSGFIGGTINGIMEKLDYIQSLGATHIWISPFFENADDGYHGYHTISYEMIDPHFGTWEDLERLIQRAHKKGLKIIADFVPNHCHINHPFFQEALCNSESPYRNWFYFKNQSNEYVSFLEYSNLAKFNLDNPDTAEYMIRVGERLTNLGIDGFRIDHALGISFSFLRNFRDRMHQLNPETIVFGEVWPSGIGRNLFYTLRFKSIWHKFLYRLCGINQELIQRDYEGILDGVLDFKFRELLIKELQKGHRLINNATLEKQLKRHFAYYSSRSFKPYLFVDNHDTNRFLYYCNGDQTLLDEALTLMRNTGLEYIVYYGTECGMRNTETIENAEPYADRRVREPMNWSIKHP